MERVKVGEVEVFAIGEDVITFEYLLLYPSEIEELLGKIESLPSGDYIITAEENELKGLTDFRFQRK